MFVHCCFWLPGWMGAVAGTMLPGVPGRASPELDNWSVPVEHWSSESPDKSPPPKDLGWCFEALMIPCAFAAGGSPVWSVWACGVWRAEVRIPSNAPTDFKVSVNPGSFPSSCWGWTSLCFKDTNGCWEEERTLLISLAAQVWLRWSHPEI